MNTKIILWDIITHNYIYTTAPREPASQFENQPNAKYQTRRSNTQSQPKSYSYMIQDHALHELQCLVSGKLDNKIISILIDSNRQDYG